MMVYGYVFFKSTFSNSQTRLLMQKDIRLTEWWVHGHPPDCCQSLHTTNKVVFCMLWPACEVHNQRGRQVTWQVRMKIRGVSKFPDKVGEGVGHVISAETNNSPRGNAAGHIWGGGAEVGKSPRMLEQVDLYNLQITSQVLQLALAPPCGNLRSTDSTQQDTTRAQGLSHCFRAWHFYFTGRVCVYHRCIWSYIPVRVPACTLAFVQRFVLLSVHSGGHSSNSNRTIISNDPVS